MIAKGGTCLVLLSQKMNDIFNTSCCALARPATPT